MLYIAVSLVVAGAASCTAAQGTDSKAQRTAFASHALGINFAFMEAQRAGLAGDDSSSLFPGVWSWKSPAYTNMCSEVIDALDPEDAQRIDLAENGGFFEAGNAVTATATMAFTATQRALGALAFMPMLAANKPVSGPVDDSAQCLEGPFTDLSLKELYLREMSYMARSLENTLLKTREDGSDFMMLIGVADSTTYGTAEPPSWGTPPLFQQKCYIADFSNPAADVAGAVAAALAMSAKVSLEHNGGDNGDAERWLMLADRAFQYAKRMTNVHGDNGTCTKSTAVDNCIGRGCEELDEFGDPVRGTCVLYASLKPPRQHLFTAAAALYFATGLPKYKAEADYLWYVDFATFIFNWNNVASQGMLMMSMAPDMPGARYTKDYYHVELQQAAGFWSQCSNDGVLAYLGNPYCKVTPDGSAYPLDFPWGNMGSIGNGICLSMVYQFLDFDDEQSSDRKRNRCFIQRQLGYIFNHKCAEKGSSCNTKDDEGFSYMVGFGNHYPDRLHSRDAAYPNFGDNSEKDGNVLCGAMVSGPYAPEGEDGPVPEGTDTYTNSRKKWQESEPALDYTAGLICSLMGYAALPDGAFDDPDCDVRTPFTGRTAAAPGAGASDAIFEQSLEPLS